MTNIPAVITRDQARWDAMHITPSRIPEFDKIAKRCVAPNAKARFMELEQATGVPWFIIAVIAVREYGGPPIWTKQLSQGDPLNRVSTHVPKGRGPFLDHVGDTELRGAWFRGGLDALIDCAPHASRWKNWTPGGALTILTAYNGFGYDNMGRPSPYIFAGTDQYVRGKYTYDGHFDANAVDVQPGCAPLIKRMMVLDPSIKFGAPIMLPPPSPPVPAPPPDQHDEDDLPDPNVPGGTLSPKAPADNWLSAILDITLDR